MRVSPSLILSMTIIAFTASTACAAETRLWGRVATTSIDEAAGGVEGGETVPHMSAVSFRRSSNRITRFKATVPIRCVSVDGLVSYHDYFLDSSDELPYITINANRVRRLNFLEEQGDLLLNNVGVEISGRFITGTKATFTVMIQTDNNGSDQSSCTGSMTLTNVIRGVRVR